MGTIFQCGKIYYIDLRIDGRRTSDQARLIRQ